jgi:nucleoside phosphorylase
MIRALPLLLWLFCASQALAAPAVSLRVTQGERLAAIAARHGVSVRELRAANPGVAGPLADGQWLLLPEAARLPSRPVVALMASGYQEIGAIVQEARIEGVYRIVGREFHVGSWQGVPMVAGVVGGNMNNAAIGVTLLLAHFNVRVMGLVGIAGGGGTTRVGDALVATGVLQHDQGNWYDFELPDGREFAGLAWYLRGQPLVADAGRVARLVLFPRPALLERIQRSVRGLQLPQVPADIAAFHGVEPYRPSVLLDGWSASGSQFVTSRQWRDTIERRVALAARQLAVTAPRHLVIDQEDFAAAQAAEEHGVPWFIVRVIVDLAAQRQPQGGVPLDLYDRPEEIPGWMASNEQQSHRRDFDWSYFYRLVAEVLRPAVVELGAEPE